MVGLGGALGVFLGANLNFLTGLLVLVFLAVYDVVAVYYGPVGRIASSGMEQLKGLSFTFKDIQMGLGDLVFYSLLTGNILINFNAVACLFSVVGILAGSYLTFLVLEKKEVFPGLPLPVALGLVFGLLRRCFRRGRRFEDVAIYPRQSTQVRLPLFEGRTFLVFFSYPKL